VTVGTAVVAVAVDNCSGNFGIDLAVALVAVAVKRPVEERRAAVGTVAERAPGQSVEEKASVLGMAEAVAAWCV
jgi:hypothetical protein